MKNFFNPEEVDKDVFPKNRDSRLYQGQKFSYFGNCDWIYKNCPYSYILYFEKTTLKC